MNIFGWLLLFLAVLLLVGISSLTVMIILQMRGIRKGKRSLSRAPGRPKPVRYLLQHILRAIGAGLAGTVVFILFLSELSPRLGLGRVDYPHLLGGFFPAAVGFPESEFWILAGWLLCALVGVGWALIYAFYVHDRLLGPGWVQGLIYAATGVFLMSSLVFLPVLGWIHRLVRSGQMPTSGIFGLDLFSGRIVLARFLGHCLFGFILGLLYRRKLVFS